MEAKSPLSVLLNNQQKQEIDDHKANLSSALNDTAYLPDQSHSPSRSPMRQLRVVGTPRQFPEIDVKN